MNIVKYTSYREGKGYYRNTSMDAESQTRAKLDQGGEKAKIIGKDNRVLC